MSSEIYNMIDRKVINSNAKEVAVFLLQIRALTGKIFVFGRGGRLWDWGGRLYEGWSQMEFRQYLPLIERYYHYQQQQQQYLSFALYLITYIKKRKKDHVYIYLYLIRPLDWF